MAIFIYHLAFYLFFSEYSSSTSRGFLKIFRFSAGNVSIRDLAEKTETEDPGAVDQTAPGFIMGKEGENEKALYLLFIF